MKKILLTGFGPFGENTVNPSWLAVEATGEVDGYDIRRVRLPVEWGKARDILYASIDDFKPDMCLMIGLAASSDRIRIERIGVNLCGAIRDNMGLYPDMQGDVPRECRAADCDVDALFSTFDYAAVKRSLDAVGIPAAYSYSAGTYLCNYVLFSALLKARLDNRNMKAGFIHVPCVAGHVNDNQPSLPLDTITLAVMTAMVHSMGDN
ncbi:MAG: hypothetical protein MJ101_04095 [Clostridia bacterium]|nr:hypothetical protein [Clostridia bacterium]